MLGQFAASFCLLVLAFSIAAQVNHVARLDRKVDFSDRWEILSGHTPTIGDTSEVGEKLATLRNELRRLPGIVSASANSGGLPAKFLNLITLPRSADRPTLRVEALYVDPAFAVTFGLPMLAGRFFNDDIPTDRIQSTPNGPRGAVAVSRSSLPVLGLSSPEAALGHEFQLSISGGRAWVTIVGVVDDIHWKGGKADPGPLFYLYHPSSWLSVTYQVDPLKAEAIRDDIQALAKSLLPNSDQVPLQNRLDLLAIEERQLARSFWLFAAVASAVAAAGLFGLTRFLVERHARQIAIRRVFGATRTQIFRWVGGRMLLPVLGFFILAALPARLLVDWWLSGYSLRFEPGFSLLLGPAAILLCLAGLTVGLSVNRVVSRPPQRTLGGDATS